MARYVGERHGSYNKSQIWFWSQVYSMKGLLLSTFNLAIATSHPSPVGKGKAEEGLPFKLPFAEVVCEPRKGQLSRSLWNLQLKSYLLNPIHEKACGTVRYIQKHSKSFMLRCWSYRQHNWALVYVFKSGEKLQYFPSLFCNICDFRCSPQYTHYVYPFLSSRNITSASRTVNFFPFNRWRGTSMYHCRIIRSWHMATYAERHVWKMSVTNHFIMNKLLNVMYKIK